MSGFPATSRGGGKEDVLPRNHRLGTWGAYIAVVLVFAAAVIQGRGLTATPAQLAHVATASSPVEMSSPGAQSLRDDMPQFAGEAEFYNEDWSEQVGWVMWECTGTRHSWGYSTENMIVIDPPYKCSGPPCIGEFVAQGCTGGPYEWSCLSITWPPCW